MPLASMTGFARISGVSGAYTWAWELKTVNAKALDLRLRVPPGFDDVEAQARVQIAQRLTRGTCHANLSVAREAGVPQVKINDVLLGVLATKLRDIAVAHSLAPASMDALLAVRGVVELAEPDEDQAQRNAAHLAIMSGLHQALDALMATRKSEGASLARILKQRVNSIARLTTAAGDAPGRQPDAVRARLTSTITALLDGTRTLDPDRLHQEAVIMAARADVQEELDRLAAHVEAANVLLSTGGPVGRRLDFLAQELGREANTLSAKSNDAALTAIGLELRVEIEQMREQIQNIE